MRVGILTLPLHNNYGGILQVFALQETLKELGLETVVLRRERSQNQERFSDKFLLRVKNFVKFLLCKERSYPPTRLQREVISQYTNIFIVNYINPCSELIYSTKKLKRVISSYGLSAVIVGSDQVWRPMYCPKLSDYFLSFGENIEKISYAASFGVDSWEFSKIATAECRRWIQKFSAVSVRELTGVNFCKEKFDIDAKLCLDPTLLIEPQKYLKILMDSNESESEGDLFVYFLDSTVKKDNLIKSIQKNTELRVFSSMPKVKVTHYNLQYNLQECIYPTVTRWLRSFVDAKLVITDSFHGCVFSIIFNKPFWVIGNTDRGMARFRTLLSIFHLEDRLIDSQKFDLRNLYKPIDWDNVNKLKEKYRADSINFLLNSLNIKEK